MQYLKNIYFYLFLILFSSEVNAKDLAQVPQSEILDFYSIVSEVSPARISKDINELANFGTRHTLSDKLSNQRGIGAATRWIYNEFQKISDLCNGCIEVMYVSDTVSGESRVPHPTEIVNVIAIQRGSERPNDFVMMSGDIDSRVSDPMNSISDSPGANDNASGMAGVLEAARVLSSREYASSIIYAGLSGEEQGLFGGQIFAKHAIKHGWDIKAVLNNDMISNIEGINGVINNSSVRIFSEGTRANETKEEALIRRFTGGEVDSPSRNLARFIKKLGNQYIVNLDIKLIYRLDRYGRGGHHRPFNEFGIPGVRIMETNEHYDRQHQDVRSERGQFFGDTMIGVDSEYAAKLTSLNLITLAQIAGAPAFPTSVELSGAVKASAKLVWENQNSSSNLMGYKVYWRETSEAEWTNSRFVGDVDEWEFKNLVIDNYFFGVSSISKDGYETPVVFPGAAGRF
ncbi:M28 family metallopeptidase [Hellea sp.]|nr:M28 family metallopeptidase [Hellea sp.]